QVDFQFQGGSQIVISGAEAGDPVDSMKTIVQGLGSGLYFFDVFADNAVDYSLSTGPVVIDLGQPVQHSGFAEGDTLTSFDFSGAIDSAIFEITGSVFDDVIRGIDRVGTPAGRAAIFNNPGDNVLNGGGGNDVLEGRGGADVLNGGLGTDIASYESSP